jgi:hypothetical protein
MLSIYQYGMVHTLDVLIQNYSKQFACCQTVVRIRTENLIHTARAAMLISKLHHKS